MTSLSPSLLLETLSFVADLHDDDTVLQQLEVRRLLEPAATAMACTRITTAEIESLRHLNAELGRTTSVDELVRMDLQFHHRIVVASGNDYLVSLLDSLSTATVRARIWRGLTQSRAVTRTIKEHGGILDALAGWQPEIARSWATVHVAGVEEWLRQCAVTPKALEDVG